MQGGRCYCGEIRFEVEGALGPLIHCHCRDCRRVGGTAFATTVFLQSAQLRWIAGEEQIVERESGRGARYFCGTCGTRLFNRPAEDPSITMLMAASLDPEPTGGAIMHVNVESKAPWYEIQDDLPQHLGLPWR